MQDQTIPLKGGWVLCTKMPPTIIRPKLFGVYYAKPEKVFEWGSFEIGHCSTVRPAALRALYKQRQRANLTAAEKQELVNLGVPKRRQKALQLEDPPLWAFEGEPPAEGEPDLNHPEIKLQLRVRILTADGEVCLEPHEYSVIPDIQEYINEIGEPGGMIMHELGGMDNAKKFREQLFYVMSRGVGKIEAFKLLLGQIDRWNIFWLETHPDTVAYFRR